MDRFEKRKARSKEEIRRAAEELFSRFGTEKVSITDIALKAGVSQATVYNNFGTKEELVKDYRKSIMSGIAGKFHDILVWKKSWIDKFQGLIQTWIEITERYDLETSARTKDNVKQPPTINLEIENNLLQFIEEGKKQKQLRDDVSSEAILTYLKFYQEGITNHPEILKKDQTDNGLSGDLMSLFIYGIYGKQYQNQSS